MTPISLQYSEPDPKIKQENHLMHGVYAAAAVALISKYGFKKETSDALILGLLAGGGTFFYMNKYGHEMPFEWKKSH